MGDGLKRVAKQCGGLVATSGKSSVHYNADGSKEAGMTHDWFERRVRELEAQLVERTKERDEAKSEIAMIRENCYYACVSKKHAQADLHRVAKDFGEVADHWRKRATELETVARELIDSTDTSMDGPTTVAVVDGAPFDRLKALISGQ